MITSHGLRHLRLSRTCRHLTKACTRLSLMRVSAGSMSIQHRLGATSYEISRCMRSYPARKENFKREKYFMKPVIPDSQVHSPPAWIGRKEDIFLDSPYSKTYTSLAVETEYPGGLRVWGYLTCMCKLSLELRSRKLGIVLPVLSLMVVFFRVW